MKKIITLIIFAGLTSAVFAQSGYDRENKNKSYGNGYHQSQNNGSGYDRGNREKDYAYGDAGYSRDGDHDGYSRHDRGDRDHRRDQRQRREHRWFHRDRHYDRD